MTREEIEKHTIAFPRTAGGTRPDLRVVELEGRRVVVKDFLRSDFLFRAFVGPILIRRESAALARLCGIANVPQLLQRLDRYAMVIEHVDGTALRDFEGEIPEGFFDELMDAMNAIHSRGVTHCDLRSSGNVMISSDGKPRVVDFAACVMRGRGLNPFINFLFRQFVESDNYAVLMLKRKHAPDQLRPEEIGRLNTPLPYEQLAKNIGGSIRKITRKLMTKKK